MMLSGQHEDDYRRVTEPAEQARFLHGTAIEIVREPTPGVRRHVLFDFDGTLSLIREGWPQVMVPMMVDALQAAGSGESADELAAAAHEFVMELNGKQTIYQMIRLADEVRLRGGVAEEPLVYKQRYHELLMQRIVQRREALRAGSVPARQMLVPGSLDILEALCDRGAALYLASGTDREFVIEEVALLGLDRFFGRHVYGALDNYQDFSKAAVIEQILREAGAGAGAGELVGFGDGYVEIQNIKQAGGVAVAVASDETNRSGRPDPWKRDRLIGVGADLVVPDFRDWRVLLNYLWGDAA